MVSTAVVLAITARVGGDRNGIELDASQTEDRVYWPELRRSNDARCDLLLPRLIASRSANVTPSLELGFRKANRELLVSASCGVPGPASGGHSRS